jgi:hypothetical protein
MLQPVEKKLKKDGESIWVTFWLQKFRVGERNSRASVNIERVNRKTAIDVMKTRPCFDPSTSSGFSTNGLERVSLAG